MASVKENIGSDGKVISYRWRACIGRDDTTGKQIFATKTVPAPAGLTPAKAKKTMQAQADLWEESVKKGNAPIKDESFKSYIESQFLPVHVCNGKHSPSTIAFYKDICGQLVDRFGRKDLDKITSLDIERYLVDLSNKKRMDKDGNEKPLSASHIKHFRTVLTVAFNFAEKHRLISSNPMRFVDPVKAERKTVDFLTDEEVLLFKTALEEEESLYWKTAITTLIYCGLRRGELCGLQWRDLDFKAGTMDIQRNVICNSETGGKCLVKETKTATSDRQIPVPSSVISMLKALKAEQEKDFGVLLPYAFIFGNITDCYSPNRPDNITRWLNRFEKRHGLRNVSPHDLRHTCGTLLLQSGATIKETQTILGHADASTTLKFYVGVDNEKLKSAMDRMESMLEAT